MFECFGVLNCAFWSLVLLLYLPEIIGVSEWKRNAMSQVQNCRWQKTVSAVLLNSQLCLCEASVSGRFEIGQWTANRRNWLSRLRNLRPVNDGSVWNQNLPKLRNQELTLMLEQSATNSATFSQVTRPGTGTEMTDDWLQTLIDSCSVVWRAEFQEIWL